MALWFQKGDFRRFTRIEMPIKIYINPIHPIKNQDVFALGLDYFPPTVKQKIKTSQEELSYWVRHIQEQQEILLPVFNEFEAAILYFGQCVAQLSNGFSPKMDRLAWADFNRYLKGINGIADLKNTAPKTHQYFEQLNQKLKVYFQNMAYCLEDSTPTQLSVESALPDSMLVDDMMKRFEAENFAKIPLVQSLFNLHQLMVHYFKAYQELLNDCRLRQNPKAWPEVKVDISACGLSMKLDKRFKANMRCDAYFYFAEKSRLLSVRAHLIRACSDMSDYKECNAFNFEFQDLDDQRFIQLEVERFEIKSSLQTALEPL